MKKGNGEFMENLNKKTQEMKNEIITRNNKQYTKAELITIDSIRRVKNPFRMISVRDVMKDLNICETIAYKLFKRPDFPSINVGKNNQVMLLAYLLWKMEKRN